MCLISDIGFEVPDAFLVGYALDYNEYFRDLSVSDLFTTSKIGNPLISFVYYVYMAPAIIGGALSCQSQMCLQVDYLHILEFSDWLIDWRSCFPTAHLHTEWWSQGEVQRVMTRKRIVASEHSASEGFVWNYIIYFISLYYSRMCDHWAVNNFKNSTFVFI